jgi:hypothetical protein
MSQIRIHSMAVAHIKAIHARALFLVSQARSSTAVRIVTWHCTCLNRWEKGAGSVCGAWQHHARRQMHAAAETALLQTALLLLIEWLLLMMLMLMLMKK